MIPRGAGVVPAVALCHGSYWTTNSDHTTDPVGLYSVSPFTIVSVEGTTALHNPLC